MDVLLAGFALLALLMVLVTGAVLTAAVLAVRGVRRRVRPAAQRAGSGLRALRPGPAGEAARLALELSAGLRRARAALAASRASGAPVGEVPALLRQLEGAAGEVRRELRAVEAVADPARAGVLLAGARDRAGQLRAGLDDVCAGLAHAAAAAGDDVARLREACAAEAAALREGARVRRLTGM